MAIDAKQSFLSQVEKKCADRLTVTDLSGLMGIISDVMEGFRMEEINRDAGEMSEDDMLDAYEASMHVQGRSEKTIQRYIYIIRKFMGFVKTRTRNINVYHIRNWLAAEQRRGIMDSTLEGNRQVLSAYFGWLFREGLIEKNPMSNIGTIKVAKREKKTYSDVELEKLNRCCKTARDRAILHFLRSTGCRISEMTELNRDAVDMASRECVVHGKGDKERVVFLDAVACMHLKEYLDSRKDFNEALFIGVRRERLEPDGVRCMLRTLGRDAGVEHVHPHKFRRTLATELARKGMQIQKIAGLLGHEKLDTTMKYVINNREDMKADYRRYA